jgi:hypothetical protein
MKDLLIVVSPTTGHQRGVCDTMQTEASKINKSVRRVLETAFLVSGPKSFEIAMLLHHIASDNNVPVAIFEIEGLLFSQPQGAKHNLNQ